MFTGIVEDIGKVREIIKGRISIRIVISSSKVIEEVNIGDSIAVNGICLTVTEFGEGYFASDVMPETMRRTNLGDLKPNDRVNLERALKLSDRLGGHIVTGHIDGVATIAHVNDEDNAIWVTLQANDDVLKYIVMKGSVAIDGTSLTVSYVNKSVFKVSLIPLTSKHTTLGSKKVGEKVNIECDILGKYIERLFNRQDLPKKDISMDFLKENGFL